MLYKVITTSKYCVHYEYTRVVYNIVTYNGKLLFDFDEAPIDMFGLSKQVLPLLVDTLHCCELLLCYCYLVHSQSSIALLDISVLNLHIQGHEPDI